MDFIIIFLIVIIYIYHVVSLRYGGGFMSADYGAGELPQAFCRVAAVHGATYVLRCPVHSLLMEQTGGRCAGVRLQTGQVGILTLITESSGALPDLQNTCRGVGRLPSPWLFTDSRQKTTRTARVRGAEGRGVCAKFRVADIINNLKFI
jgi:hypothetical protein